MRIRPPVTRDQEYYAAILDELRQIRLVLKALVEEKTYVDGVRCEECGRVFRNDRALRAHMRTHGGG